MNTETLTAFVAGMTATIIICGVIFIVRSLFPQRDEQDDIDWDAVSFGCGCGDATHGCMARAAQKGVGR